MKYARIVNGIVVEIIDNIDQSQVFTDLSFKFTFNKRIDNLEVQPEIGWTYNKETGFNN